MTENFRTYLHQKNALIENKNKINWQEENIERQFNFVSAELLNFLPEIPFKDHKNIFEKILLNSELNKLEQRNPFALENVVKENFSIGTEKYLKKYPCIFCAWHFGAYKLINHFIAQNKIPFCLVISRTIFQADGKSILEDFDTMYENFQGNKFQIIDAESANAGLSILRKLREGFSILFYMDGNTGIGSARESDNCYIKFLGSKIYARKGVAYLSHLSKIPILPIISRRTPNGEIRFLFKDLIYPDTRMSRYEFAINCTQHLYDLFDLEVRACPEQWETWLYLYKVLKSNNIKMKQVECEPRYFIKKMIFNSSAFGVYKWNQSYYLLNKKNLFSFCINRDLYYYLKSEDNENLKIEGLDKSLFCQLFKNQVIVCSKEYS